MAGSPARRWTGRSAGCWPISRRRSAKPAKPSSPASATRAGLSLRAGYDNGGFSGATTDRPALQRLLAEITAARAPAIRSAASSPTSSPAVRYWNRARQRYHRLSARYSRARVSLPTQAARPGPDNRGKPRLLDLERRIPARDRFAPDSPLEGSGFEPVWGFSCQVVFLVCRRFFVRSGKAVLHPVACDRFAERAEGGKGPKR